MLLFVPEAAQNVVIIPGYGMPTIQAYEARSSGSEGAPIMKSASP